MSADGSANRRNGFERWVASMKRDHEPVASKPVTLKPVVHQKLELDLDDGATRIQKFPKELIHRLREQEKAKSVPPPQKSAPPGEDRTAVFRAPPELLARARELRSARSAHTVEEIAKASEMPTKPPPGMLADDPSADSGVQYLTDGVSGISLRSADLPEIPAPLSEEPPPSEASGVNVISSESSLPDADDWSLPEQGIEDPTLIRSEGLSWREPARLTPRADESPVGPLVESDPVTEALLNTDVDALLAPASSAQARTVEHVALERTTERPLGRLVVIAVALVVIAVAVLVRWGMN